MARYITLLLLIATCYAQESSNAWLDITLEKDKTPQNVESNIINKDDTIYFTIQVAARKNFPEAIDVVKKLNELGFDAFIQKNDTNPKARYRIRYGNFSSKKDASKIADIIKEKLGYDCWIDKIEL
ncbi:MAG TPA: SPOR domain-containing protein [Candidatus Marinimicrobia bacterium]|jgi:cell division septation protein DedD|nr:SPOR domain-containing protein [Candidatus Neomarinimicrobiota bacterium]|tara:strand:+ start:3102 stop:3479 length:378 start_codon:yes stop_codon:yes gene_type:complete